MREDPAPAPSPPAGYTVVRVNAPTPLPRVLATGLGRASRMALVNPTPGAPPRATLNYGPRTIDRHALAAYQRLIGYPVSDAVPTGWVHVMAFPLHLTLFARPDFPLPPLGMVHVHNTITHLRAISAPEELTFTCWAENLRPHKRGATIEIYATAHAPDGELVWHGVSTYLAKGGLAPTPADSGITPSDEDADAVGHHVPKNLPGHHLWRLPKGLGKEYAEVSGDSNPIHTTTLAAKAFGFRGPIVHGMYTAARALAEVPHPDAFVWHVDFFSPVIPPAKVTLEFGQPDAGAPPSAPDSSEARAKPTALTVMRVVSRTKTHLIATVAEL